MSDDMRWGQEPQDTGHPPTGPGGTSGNADENVMGSGQLPPRYSHYQVHQEQTPQLPPTDGRPPRNRRSNKHSYKNSFGRKAGTTVALAVIFGLVAGIVFQGVNIVSRTYLGTDQQSQIGMTNTIPDTTSQGSSTDGSDTNNLLVQSGSVAGVAQAAMPSVVAITTVSIQQINSFFGFYGRREYPTTGTGSGIIVGENDSELLIATNNHVVEDATTLSVCFIGDDVISAEEETQNLAATSDGDINVEDAVTAKIKGTDEDNDLAVVAVMKSDIPEDTMSQIKIAQIGSSDSLVVGEQVVAIGNALGYGQSVTSGWISALNRSLSMEDGVNAELIQTDAAINPGNSGGALLNMRGELIGINSAKYADNAVEGMGYAIPISKAKPILEDLMNRKSRDKVEEGQAAYLGVKMSDLSVEAIQMYNMPAGAFVTEVMSGDPAEAAGIHKGDIIVKMDGQKVSGREDLLDKLAYYAAGETVTFVVARAGNGGYTETSVEVTLGARSE
ncbi:trypsin-like peptidase domain-containing protein [Blautia schinkii]|nr:trypsin-like peptidase domain-containing protein [Blautia schinkii]